MARKKGNRALLTAGAILFVLLVVIGVIALLRGLNADEPTETATPDTSQQETETTQTEPEQEPDEETSTSVTDPASEIDPANIATIDIAPMSIVVSYVKGVGGFEFEVARTNSGTQYVEFKSPDLIGSKCTDDEGVFASIIENPSSNEASAINKTTKAGDTSYGLSLVAANCTSNPQLLDDYQTSFSDVFSLLEKM